MSVNENEVETFVTAENTSMKNNEDFRLTEKSSEPESARGASPMGTKSTPSASSPLLGKSSVSGATVTEPSLTGLNSIPANVPPAVASKAQGIMTVNSLGQKVPPEITAPNNRHVPGSNVVPSSNMSSVPSASIPHAVPAVPAHAVPVSGSYYTMPGPMSSAVPARAAGSYSSLPPKTASTGTASTGHLVPTAGAPVGPSSVSNSTPQISGPFVVPPAGSYLIPISGVDAGKPGVAPAGTTTICLKTTTADGHEVECYYICCLPPTPSLFEMAKRRKQLKEQKEREKKVREQEQKEQGEA